MLCKASRDSDNGITHYYVTPTIRRWRLDLGEEKRKEVLNLAHQNLLYDYHNCFLALTNLNKNTHQCISFHLSISNPPFANQLTLKSTTNKVIFFWMNSTRSKWKPPTPTFCILAFLAFWSSLRPSFLAYQMEANIVWLSGISPFELWVNTVEEPPVSASEREREREKERERCCSHSPLPSVIIYTYTLSLEQVREKEGGQKETQTAWRNSQISHTLSLKSHCFLLSLVLLVYLYIANRAVSLLLYGIVCRT